LAPSSTALSSETLHATTVAIDGRGVVFEGASGAGKSDLALRLIDRGARLVSDDRSLLVRIGDALIARAPDRMAGRIEVRGVGIAVVPCVAEARVELLVRLDPDPPRLPERRRRTIAGVEVRMLTLDPRSPSAPIAVEIALRQPEATPA
jgi:serine kinase of HPr protein (carbohydrate metabolism regulator)